MLLHFLSTLFNILKNISCQVFVGARLHVTGGVLRGGRAVEGEAAVAGL